MIGGRAIADRVMSHGAPARDDTCRHDALSVRSLRERDAQACGKSLFEVPKFAVNRDLTLTYLYARKTARGRIYFFFFSGSRAEGESPPSPNQNLFTERQKNAKSVGDRRRREKRRETQPGGLVVEMGVG